MSSPCCLLRLLSRPGRAAGVLLLSSSSSRFNPQYQPSRCFHSSPVSPESRPVPTDFTRRDDSEEQKSLVEEQDLFEQISEETKTKATFNQAIDFFIKRDVRRRGHVEFIYAALKKMPEYGVERDLSVYNKLLDVFPKEVFVPTNYIQRMFNHYPRQQECGVMVLDQMEYYGILPSIETEVLLTQIFGPKSHPFRKFQRILYWFPKLKHINPYRLPEELPEDPVDLARLGLTHIANDLDAKVTVYQHPGPELTESGEEINLPYIVGVQSPDQMELLSKHNPKRPVFVEGPFPLWLRSTLVYYYILRADPLPPEEQIEEPYDPERCFYYPLQLDLDLERDLGEEECFDVDDLDEGLVFAMCMTSQGDQATLNQWISGLQLNNPILSQVPTLFRLSSGPREVAGTNTTGSGQRHRPPPETQHEDPQSEEHADVHEDEEQRRSHRMKQ